MNTEGISLLVRRGSQEAFAVALFSLLAPVFQASAQPTADKGFFVIPIQGRIGADVYATGIDTAAKQAKSRGISKLLFYIDSPGGMVVDGVAIASEIAKLRDDFEVHCLIKSAMSAAIHPLIESEFRWVTGDAAAGAAVLYRIDSDTGEVEVDEKMNAAIASQMAGKAASRGLPPQIFRAMVQMKAEVYGKETPGGWVFFDQKPPNDPDAILIDGPESVLSLSVEQLERYGIAKALPDSGTSENVGFSAAKGLGKLVDGSACMRSGAEKIRKIEDRNRKRHEDFLDDVVLIEKQFDFILREAQRARDAHPSTIQVWYDPLTGDMTKESQARWISATDRAVDYWRSVQNACRELDAIYSRMRTLRRSMERSHEDAIELRLLAPGSAGELPEKMFDHPTPDVREELEEAKSEIESLLRRRNRTRVDQ